jgi:arylsulfatase A-like enzyme
VQGGQVSGCEQQVGHVGHEGVDILPTIMACVGGAEDPLWEGRSLRPYLLGDAVPGPKTTAFYDYDFRFDPDPTLGDLARLPADARSVSVALGAEVAPFEARVRSWYW